MVNGTTRPRPIIVRFTRHNKKVEILRKRRQLRDRKSPFQIQEDLTETRRHMLKFLREEHDEVISKVRTIDGVILFRPTSYPTLVERCNTLKEVRQAVDKYG